MAPIGVLEKMSGYEAKNFSNLLGMVGFSDTLLKNHFKLYEGYVQNTNALIEKVNKIEFEGKPPMEYSELKRRFGFEFDGMRLHELYFGNLIKGGKPLDPASPLAEKIKEVYGGFDGWKKHFVATGLMKGVGWAVLYYDPQNHRLYNVWIAEHETNHLAGCKPILVMDVWEHAYMTDYQLDRGKYIEAFMKNINWDEAVKRFNHE
jgi:superoxide dismutase, Fe-Mn family